MNINKINLIYFPTTGHTQKVIKQIVSTMNTPYNEYNLTHNDQNNFNHNFKQTDFVIIGFPVYSGRVPMTFMQRLQKITGSNTPAVIVCTYGNRDYDDSLLEMNNFLKDHGFKPMCAAAIVTQHNIITNIATDRPDKNDLMFINNFTNEIVNKLTTYRSVSDIPDLVVKGNFPYRKYLKIPLIPIVSNSCRGCRKCAQICPTGAIPTTVPWKTDHKKCIGCSACINICPTKAREFPKLKIKLASLILCKSKKIRQEPESFF